MSDRVYAYTTNQVHTEFRNGQVYALLGENTTAAQAAAGAAGTAANSVLAAARYFPSQALGEAGSTTGQFFSHPDGGGGLVYREKTASGSFVIANAATTAALSVSEALLNSTKSLLQTVAPLAMAAGALAIYDLALAFSGGIDGSHYLILKQFLFQDSAGTIAVTGTEQPVRCIKSPLGVAGWDLISEVGRPAATYFETAWGTAFVRLAAGTCLYTRTVQKIRGKSFLAAGANFSSSTNSATNAIFGAFKYTATYWRLGTQTIDRVAVEISGGTDLPARPYLFDCAGANYGYQPGSPQVIHATHSAGVLETTFDQSTWADSFSPKNTGWLDTDEILGARYGVNIQTNDAAGAPVPNPTTTVDFYGGVIMVGAAPTPEVKTAIVASLQARMHPPITAADKVVLVVADSISDSVGTDVAAGVTEWVRKLGTRLQTKYPDHCVFVRDWNSNGDCYMGYRRFGSIYATKRLFVINASRAGSQPGYFMAERFDRAIGWLPKCDWHIIAHGHNIPVDDATIRASAKVYLYRLGTLMMAQDKLRQKFPMGQPIIITPYPVQAVGDQKILGVKNSIDQGMVPVYGDQVVIDLHTPWEVAGRPANRYVDGVHPTVPVGVDAMDAVIWPVLDALPSARTTQATPAVITQRRLGNTADQLLANGTFDQFTAGDPTGVPVGWEPFGAVVVSRSNELAGRSTTIKLVKAGTGASAGLRQTIDAVALRGLDVCLLVRRFMLKGSGFSTGGMRFRCGGGDTLGDGRWVDYEYLAHSKMLEGYFPFPVPNTATTLTVELLAGDAGESGTVWWDYSSLVTGILPRAYIT